MHEPYLFYLYFCGHHYTTSRLLNVEKRFEAEKKKLEETINQKDNSINSITSQYHKMLIENSLNNALSEANVADAHKGLLKDAFRGRALVEINELDPNKRDILITTDEGRLPVTEYFKSWTESEAAKPYIKAKVPAGGGGSGNIKIAGVELKGKTWEDLSLGERTKLFQTDRATYDRLLNESKNK